MTALLAIAALIFINAVYVAAEFAAVSVRRSRIRQLAANGNRLAAWLLPVLTSPGTLDRYIAACQIGITVSGLVLARLERIPSAGDKTDWQGLSIEVVDMDGRRIDKLLVRRHA